MTSIEAAQKILDSFAIAKGRRVVDVRESGALEMTAVFDDGTEQRVVGLWARMIMRPSEYVNNGVDIAVLEREEK